MATSLLIIMLGFCGVILFSSHLVSSMRYQLVTNGSWRKITVEFSLATLLHSCRMSGRRVPSRRSNSSLFPQKIQVHFRLQIYTPFVMNSPMNTFLRIYTGSTLAGDWAWSKACSWEFIWTIDFAVMKIFKTPTNLFFIVNFGWRSEHNILKWKLIPLIFTPQRPEGSSES
jgi:hypothetical protein